uniref:SJCHGC05175 protein n=1 Tax=Schistosoma japonicum TaxID=6182 RepID=Q5BSB7_SCHJA|nr:SJCHGC05175 protein [Schistosoma japonicum]
MAKSSQYNELKKLLMLALPTMLSQLLRFINPSISVMVCGHLSREELDAASLANCITNILGLSIDTGFSSACDTLFSQPYALYA